MLSRQFVSASRVNQFFWSIVKVRLQHPETMSRYRNGVTALVRIIQEERVAGLFKGISSPMVRSSPHSTSRTHADKERHVFRPGRMRVFERTRFRWVWILVSRHCCYRSRLHCLVFLKLASCDLSPELMRPPPPPLPACSIRAQLSDPNDEPTLTQITLGGAGTGILASLIATPTELIKIRQQANTSTGVQPSAWTVAKDLYRGHGVRGLYRGITSTALRDTSYGEFQISVTCEGLVFTVGL